MRIEGEYPEGVHIVPIPGLLEPADTPAALANLAIRRKIERLRKGERPRVLDLFAGCGGLSLGFNAAGFNIVAAVENDPDAARSHGANFHDSSEEHSKARDVLTPPEEFARSLELGPVMDAFDVIVGGPPCQAFARVGRPKLREVDDHPQAFLHDPRARLFLEWLRYVDTCRPLAVLMENVPDVLNHGGENIAEETSEVLENKGYICAYTLLNASLYGVPQMRETDVPDRLPAGDSQQSLLPRTVALDGVATRLPGIEGCRLEDAPSTRFARWRA